MKYTISHSIFTFHKSGGMLRMPDCSLNLWIGYAQIKKTNRIWPLRTPAPSRWGYGETESHCRKGIWEGGGFWNCRIKWVHPILPFSLRKKYKRNLGEKIMNMCALAGLHVSGHIHRCSSMLNWQRKNCSLPFPPHVNKEFLAEIFLGPLNFEMFQSP